MPLRLFSFDRFISFLKLLVVALFLEDIVDNSVEHTTFSSGWKLGVDSIATIENEVVEFGDLLTIGEDSIILKEIVSGDINLLQMVLAL